MPYAAIQNPVCGYKCYCGALWFAEPYFDRMYHRVASAHRDTVYFYRNRAVRGVEWRGIQPHVTYYAGVGHGAPGVYTGYLLNTIFFVGMENSGFKPSWIRNAVLLMLSCLTARILGPYMVRLGAWSYIGWTEEYVFCISDCHRETWPDRLFLSPIEHSFTECILRRMSPGQVVTYLKRTYLDEAERERRHPLIYKCLRWDATYLKLIGKPTQPPLPRTAPPRHHVAALSAVSTIIGLGIVEYALHRK